MYFGEIAVQENFIKMSQLEEVLDIQKEKDDWKLGELLVMLGYLEEEQVEHILKIQRHKKAGSSKKSMEIMVGYNFGSYKICSILGKGAMGVVYLAKDSKNTNIALKLIDNILYSKNTKKRFLQREAKYACQLQHENIVTTFTFGEIDRTLYLVSEVVFGSCLEKVLKQGKLNYIETLCVAYQVLPALVEIDRNNLIHRDIKPSNVLINTAGIIKVSDFGLARSTEADQSLLTETGAFMGTPLYMAPEQIRAEKDLDIRCDLYSLGIMLYHCLSGELPYQGTIAKILSQHLYEKPPKHKKINGEMEKLIHELLEKKIDKRPKAPKDVLQRVKLLLQKENSIKDLDAFSQQTVQKLLPDL